MPSSVIVDVRRQMNLEQRRVGGSEGRWATLRWKRHYDAIRYLLGHRRSIRQPLVPAASSGAVGYLTCCISTDSSAFMKRVSNFIIFVVSI